jgi:uncharacterized protein YlxP (DUF503 family)
MKNYIFYLNIALISCLCAATPVQSASIPIENASFESPAVDTNAFPALPIVDGWTEIDLDILSSANTGVFPNTDPNSPDHIINADGNQLAFLGSQAGNALQQDLAGIYQAGCDYRLTVAVGISNMFPPATEEQFDTIELVLYYRDANDPDQTLDIVSKIVESKGLSSTKLQDFSVYLPTVNPNDAWEGENIGIAIRATGAAGGFWDLDNVRMEEFISASLFIENSSFESPAVDTNAFPALPIVDGWTEIDLDILSSANTGVFPNTDPNSLDHIINADGNQLAFLGSQADNALQQDLAARYQAGCDYRLLVAVGISSMFPPAMEEPIDTIELVLYYRDANDPNQTIDIISGIVEAKGLSSTKLQDFSVYLPTVNPNDAWEGENIGIAIRATGAAGGFWDLDNIRMEEFYPVSLPVANASFELPVVDPEGYPASPIVDMWKELDLDVIASANTGVFLNTPSGSEDHMNNAHGNQLVFLGSQEGNGLEQDLSVLYQTGSTYRLTVGVGTSMRFPPSMTEPVDTLQLAFYYRDGNEPVDILKEIIPATGLSSRYLRDFSVYLSSVHENDLWADKPIGIAIRSTGAAGGYWDLDNVRLGQWQPSDDLLITTTNKE